MGLGFLIALICIISNSSVFVVQVSGSIHDYKNEGFIRQSEAFFFHGGSEGLYASKLHHSSMSQDTNKPLKGKSFIRFLFLFFIIFFNVNCT
jgi:hypothetical protein